MELSSAPPARRVLLIRHGSVDEAWRGICYGSSDVGLSERGRVESEQAAAAAAAWLAERQGAAQRLYVSGLCRARALADAIADRTGLAPAVDARLNERDHGAWEGRSWDAIYAETGAAMDGFLDAPDTFAPPAGETTFALRARVFAWYQALPSGASGPGAAGLDVVAVTHGGPIAALRGTLRGLAPRAWLALVPTCGGQVELPELPMASH